MLPSRSKRFAAPDEEIPRLVLTTPWQVALIAMMMLALLATIFPQKTLVNTLYEQKDLDPLTLSYIQNLYRAETSNMDVALLLARTQGGKRDMAALEPTLLLAAREGSPRQRQEAYTILFDAYQQQRAKAFGRTEADSVRRHLGALLKQASEENLQPQTLRAFALSAFELELPGTGMALIGRLHLAHPLAELEELGNQALARGQYQAAAACYLLARGQAATREQARRLFQKGVETYMAASLFPLAIQAAHRYLGDLEDDLPTLRFLTRTATAAGDPALAAWYARKLVFTPPMAGGRP
nr:hypothetical protein [uncultured Rhodoferax sp.]